MTYVLEKITPADQGKIILDATGNTDAMRALIYARDHQELVKTWAIDRDRDSGHYLLMTPVMMREDTANRNFYFYFNGWLHGFSVRAWFCNDAYLADYSRLHKSLLPQFQQEVRAAFAVYGEDGMGRLPDKNGYQELALVPVFRVGA